MWRLLKSEIFRQRRRPMTQIVIGLLVIIVVAFYILLWIASGRISSGSLEAVRRVLFLRETVPFALQIIWFFWGLLAVVLAAAISGSDYSWGTMRTLLTCSQSRLALFTAKLLTVLTFLVIGALIALIAALMTSTVITARNGGVDFSFVNAAYIRASAITFGRTLFTIMPYLALAICFSTIGRSTLAGVAAALGWRFLEGLVTALLTLAGGWFASVPDYLLRANVASIQFSAPLTRNLTRTLGASEEFGSNLPSLEHAVAVLSVYIVILLVTAASVFQRRDFTT